MKLISKTRKTWTYWLAIATVLLIDIYVANKLYQASQEDPGGTLLMTILSMIVNLIIIGSLIALRWDFFSELMREWGLFFKEILPVLTGFTGMILVNNHTNLCKYSRMNHEIWQTDRLSCSLISLGVGLVVAAITVWLISLFEKGRIINQDNQNG